MLSFTCTDIQDKVANLDCKHFPVDSCEGCPYLEGHGDLISRLIMGIIGVIIWLNRGY